MPDADRPAEVVLCPEDLEEIARFERWIAADAYMLAGTESIGGVCDTSLVEYVERYAREHPPPQRLDEGARATLAAANVAAAWAAPDVLDPETERLRP